MGKVISFAVAASLSSISASAGHDAPRTITELVGQGFTIRAGVGLRSIVLQKEHELYLCSLFDEVWGDQTWNTRCFHLR